MRRFFLLATAGALSACGPATPPAAEEPAGASFKVGHGVKLPPEMQASLGVSLVDVSEQELTPRVEISLHVVRSSEGTTPTSELSGWITETEATALRAGSPGTVLLANGGHAEVTVQRLEKAAQPALGEWEVSAQIATALPAGASIKATFLAPPRPDIVAVPSSAVMKTAEGEFVYAVNEDHFQRVPVTTGSRNAEAVEITEGLYAGDQIVRAPVMPIWLTELQTLRAGQSCCKGH